MGILTAGAPADPEFLTYDAAQRTVQLTVVARYNDSNSGFNLNGGFRGSHRVSVPAGWRVRVAFTNHDAIPHSLGLVRATGQLPLRIGKPAFAGAASRAIDIGIPARARDEFSFVAAQDGAYLLACGVAGHAAIGSYLQFVVSRDATVPTYETDATLARSHVSD